MRRVWTITVDVQPSDQVVWDEWEGDPVKAEMEYWDDQITTALVSVQRKYDQQLSRADEKLDYEQIDFTNFSYSVEDTDD